MSQASSVNAATPGGFPAGAGTGPALAPRNWRVAYRLIALVAIPVVLGLALAGLRITDATRSAAGYGQVARLAALGREDTGLAQALENERAGTAAFIAQGRPAAGRPALHQQYVRSDRWAATVGLSANWAPATRPRPGPARQPSWPAWPACLSCAARRRRPGPRHWP